MNRTNSIKKQLEYLMNEEENQFCFDCGKKPAHWASVNNAVYICLDCSGDHRGLGVSISYIRSVTLDTWNENQVALLSRGGNRKLREFLQFYNIPRSFPRKQLYSSKIFNYYRKMLKAEANNELFTQDVPDKREMLDPYTAESDAKLNKMMINIGTDHYSNSFSSVGNTVSSGDKFTQIDSKYGNDSRFASVTSEPWNKDEEVNPSTTDASTSSRLYSFLGSAFYKTKEIASVIKDKVYDMDIGSKLKYTGGVTVDVIKYTGSKVYEKGSNLVQSETFQNLKDRASGSLTYVVGKILYKNQEDSSTSSSSSSNNVRYASCSSGSYSSSNDEDSGSYVKMDDNKKENLLDPHYKDY